MRRDKHVSPRHALKTRQHASGEQDREPNFSWQTVRLFQELAQSLATSNCDARREIEPEPSRAKDWWRLLADISGVAPAPTRNVNGESPRTSGSFFCFDPTPGALKELGQTVQTLAGVALELSQVDQLVLKMLREVESRLARDGLQGAYAAVSRAEDK